MFKIYKKQLYIGERKILKLTRANIYRIAAKIIWIFVVILLLTTMIFGGFAMLLNTKTSPVEVIPLQQ